MTDLSGIEIISFKTGTAAAWTTANPVLGVSEPGVESDTRKWKLGDGVTAWLDLPYSSGATWASLSAQPDFPDFIAAGDTAAEARAAIDAVGTWAEAEAMSDFPDVIAAGATEEAARDAIEALGTPDINVPDGVAGLDSEGKIGDAQLPASQDLSGYATLDMLGTRIDALANMTTQDDSDLSAALASVPSDAGVTGLVGVKVAGT